MGLGQERCIDKPSHASSLMRGVFCIKYRTWYQRKCSQFTVEGGGGCSPKTNQVISSLVKYMGKMGPEKSVHYKEVFTEQLIHARGVKHKLLQLCH